MLPQPLLHPFQTRFGLRTFRYALRYYFSDIMYLFLFISVILSPGFLVYLPVTLKRARASRASRVPYLPILFPFSEITVTPPWAFPFVSRLTYGAHAPHALQHFPFWKSP